MKRIFQIVLSIMVAALLALPLTGCPGGADAPKEKKEKSQWDKDVPAPAQPASTTPEKR